LGYAYLLVLWKLARGGWRDYWSTDIQYHLEYTPKISARDLCISQYVCLEASTRAWEDWPWSEVGYWRLWQVSASPALNHPVSFMQPFSSGCFISFEKPPLTTLQSKGFKRISKDIAKATLGSRAWPALPTEVINTAIGARFEYREIFIGKDNIRYQTLVFQANAEAENRTLRALATKGKHHKLRVIVFSVDNLSPGLFYKHWSGIYKL